MKQYHDLLQDILDNGRSKEDRTGTGTTSLFGRQIRFNLQDGFPLVTTKKLFWKGIVHELLWMLKGHTNIQYLVDNGVHIWDEWADDKGYLGPVYGKMWRRWPRVNPDWDEPGTIDQINEAIQTLLHNPESRRIVISGWHPDYLPNTKYTPKQNAAMGKQALPPCHTLFQFYCEELTLQERAAIARYPLDGTFGSTEYIIACMDNEAVPRHRLSCQLYQRSADVFLGVPFNIASYALLTHIIAYICNMQPGDFVHTFGDVHIYNNHVDQVKEQLTREPRPLPQLRIRNRKMLGLSAAPEDFEFEDFELVGYDPHPPIKAEVAV